MEQYSHRNGETEPPTIDEGYFWFHTDDSVIQPHGMIHIFDGACFEDGKMWDIAELTGRWWGPVTPPWEKPDA